MANLRSNMRGIMGAVSDPKKVVPLLFVIMFLGAVCMAVLIDEKPRSEKLSDRARYVKYAQEQADRNAIVADEQKSRQKESAAQRKTEADNLLLEADKAMDAIMSVEF